MFGYPIITYELLDQLASNFKFGTQLNHRNFLSLILKFIQGKHWSKLGFQVSVLYNIHIIILL